MTADNQSPICLFFDSNGNGPSELRIIKREIREVIEGGETVVPRAFGLCWEVTGALHFVEDGGLMLDTEVATWLRDKLTAWLDAPRLAARETAEVVAEMFNFQLLRTAWEWGVKWQDDDDPGDSDTTWHDSEAGARDDFANAHRKESAVRAALYRVGTAAGVDTECAAIDIADRVIAVLRRLAPTAEAAK